MNEHIQEPPISTTTTTTTNTATNNTGTSISEQIGEAIGYAEAYVQKNIQIAKLTVSEKVAQAATPVIIGVLALMLVPVFFGMLSIGLGFLIADLLDWSYAYGFLLLTGIYLLLGVLIYLLRTRLFTNPVLGALNKKLFSEPKQKN